MAQNRAAKFAKKVAERFSILSLTDQAVNQDYKWVDEDTIKAYSVDTVAMGNYSRDGDNRYGNPNELGTTVQTMTLTRDRAFTATIDQLNRKHSNDVTNAGQFLARQVREVITPEIDTYRLAAWNTAAEANGKDDVVSDAATSTTNAYDNFLALQASLTNDLVPETNRFAFLTAAYYNFLKRSDFVLASEDFANDRKSGKYGTVDGVKLIVTPSAYMPANTDLILVHKSVMVSPMVLTDYVIHKNPKGINGNLVEGRVAYDAFVLDAKIDGVAVHRTA